MNLTTPSLLFPAISLILLAFTNRFLGLSSVIRHLHGEYQNHPDPALIRQIDNLRRRVLLVRNMQIIGTASLVCCVVCMGLIYTGHHAAAATCFGLSLVLMLISLLISVYEMMLSVEALNILLAGMEKPPTAPHRWLFTLDKSSRPTAQNEHHETPQDIQ